MNDKEKEQALLDDPRLSAYALGELSDDERAEVDALLDEFPSARQAVKEIRTLGDLLRKVKLSEPHDAASTELRAAIEEKLATPVARPATADAFGHTVGRNRSQFFGLAIAIGLLVALTAAIFGTQHIWNPVSNAPIVWHDAVVSNEETDRDELRRHGLDEVGWEANRNVAADEAVRHGNTPHRDWVVNGHLDKLGDSLTDDDTATLRPGSNGSLDQNMAPRSSSTGESNPLNRHFDQRSHPSATGGRSHAGSVTNGRALPAEATRGFDRQGRSGRSQLGQQAGSTDARGREPGYFGRTESPDDGGGGDPAGAIPADYGSEDTESVAPDPENATAGRRPVPGTNNGIAGGGFRSDSIGDEVAEEGQRGAWRYSDRATENGDRPAPAGATQPGGQSPATEDYDADFELTTESENSQTIDELRDIPSAAGPQQNAPTTPDTSDSTRARVTTGNATVPAEPSSRPVEGGGEGNNNSVERLQELHEGEEEDKGRDGTEKEYDSTTVTIAGAAIDSKPTGDRDLKGLKAEGKLAEKQHTKVLENGWRRSRKLPNTSRLMVGEREELPLEGMQANVQVDGFRARVLLDLYFYNPHARQLEGNFQLRLPNDASLYFFAFGETAYTRKGTERPSVRQAFFNLRGEKQLGTAPGQIMQARAETWKAPKEARMVTRVKAAHAYRETVRRRVDPALVEWAGAGIFAAKVFPLMPQKMHRVVIGYDVNLDRLGDDWVYRLDLPDHVGECTVDLNVVAQPGTEAKVRPEVRPFTAAGRAYFHYERPEYRQFEVRLVDAADVIVRGDDPETGPFFAASFLPELPKGGDVPGAEQAVFLVDTSLSSNPEKFNVWLSMLRATLNNNRDAIGEFAVLFFNIEQHWWRKEFVKNSQENVDDLIAHCHTLALEGATDVAAAVRTAAAPTWDQKPNGERPARDYFLLSDGAITWGERDIAALVKSAGVQGSVFSYRTGLTGTDVDLLTRLTRTTGGAVFTVADAAHVEAASRAHRKRPWQLIDVKVAGGSDLMLAGQPRTLFSGQELLLVGRGEPSDDAVITLKVRRAEKIKTIRVNVDHVVDSQFASRVYGHVATMALEELGDATEDVSTAYARHFRITGRTCSLLMLESAADYERFNIKPEDDAFVVKSTSADVVLANVADEKAQQIGNPKAAFIAWMAKLETTPGLSFRISPALRVAIDAMPESVFAIQSRPFQCNERTWETIAEPLREKLSVRDFGYDSIMKEAERRRTAAGATDALKALSSLVEYRPGDLVLARDVGFSALDWGLGDQAYHLLRRVAEARPYEPQTYLAIAHCLSGMGHADLAMIYYEITLAANWDGRFQDIKQIASVDYLHFLRQVKSGKQKAAKSDFAAARLESLSREVGMKSCDLLVTIMWNTDGTDVDMHVVEPSGEECYYQHRTTKSGGQLTRDVTQGYGPEMYSLRRAPAGEYKVRAKYFASDQNRLSTRTRVIATVYENWGTEDERVVRQTVTLVSGKQMTDIVTVKR